MADITTVRSNAVAIRDEKTALANTATRVGGVLVDLVDVVEEASTELAEQGAELEAEIAMQGATLKAEVQAKADEAIAEIDSSELSTIITKNIGGTQTIADIADVSTSATAMSECNLLPDNIYKIVIASEDESYGLTAWNNTTTTGGSRVVVYKTDGTTLLGVNASNPTHPESGEYEVYVTSEVKALRATGKTGVVAVKVTQTIDGELVKSIENNTESIESINQTLKDKFGGENTIADIADVSSSTTAMSECNLLPDNIYKIVITSEDESYKLTAWNNTTTTGGSRVVVYKKDGTILLGVNVSNPTHPESGEYEVYVTSEVKALRATDKTGVVAVKVTQTIDGEVGDAISECADNIEKNKSDITSNTNSIEDISKDLYGESDITCSFNEPVDTHTFNSCNLVSGKIYRLTVETEDSGYGLTAWNTIVYGTDSKRIAVYLIDGSILLASNNTAGTHIENGKYYVYVDDEVQSLRVTGNSESIVNVKVEEITNEGIDLNINNINRIVDKVDGTVPQFRISSYPKKIEGVQAYHDDEDNFGYCSWPYAKPLFDSVNKKISIFYSSATAHNVASLDTYYGTQVMKQYDIETKTWGRPIAVTPVEQNNRYYGYATIIDDDGNYVCFTKNGNDIGSICISKSSDAGRTWTTNEIKINDESISGDCPCSLLKTHTGRYMFFLPRVNGTSSHAIIYSDDNMETFNQIAISIGNTPYEGALIELSDNTLCLIARQTSSDYSKTGTRMSPLLYQSFDDGLNWTLIGNISALNASSTPIAFHHDKNKHEIWLFTITRKNDEGYGRYYICKCTEEQLKTNTIPTSVCVFKEAGTGPDMGYGNVCEVEGEVWWVFYRKKSNESKPKIWLAKINIDNATLLE